MKKLKSILLLGLVFVAGIVVGAIGVRAGVKKFVDRVMNQPEKIQVAIERDLTRKLKLRQEQQLKLHEITTRSMEEMKGLRAEFQPRLMAIFTNSESEVRGILDEEQKVKFDRIVRERARKSGATKK